VLGHVVHEENFAALGLNRTEQVGMRRMVVGRIGPCDLKIAL
jgi:hypothetical protein